MPDDLTERLRNYESLKFELAQVLRELRASIPQELPGAQAKLTDLFARLAEDRFNLVFIGRFNRGKTSLMNALLGSDWLPTGILPLTSAITSVAYGSTKKVQIEFEKAPFRFDIPMDALAEYITERGNPGNVRCIRQAHISLPAELLRRGFHFIDTPGLGSAIAENTRTTEDFFPEADAIVCVTAYDAPLTEDETRVLRTFARAQLPTLVVLNKQDTVSAAEREQILTYVRQQLASMFPDVTPLVLSVSATQALGARVASDTETLAASGLPDLEGTLAQLLTVVKRPAIISGVRDRAIALLDDIKPRDERILRERLQRVRVRDGSGSAGAQPIRPAPSSQGLTSCEVCQSVGSGLYDFLRKYQHELADSPVARERLAAAGGLCPRHTWLYASMSRDRDICLALTPLMSRVAHELAVIQKDCRPAGGVESSSPPENPFGGACALCGLQEQLESASLRDIANLLSEDSGASQDLPAVCLPHLRKLSTEYGRFKQVASRDVAIHTLVQRLARAADRLAEDMQRYVLRRDAIRHGLVSEEENQAAKRALSFLAGSRAFPPLP